MATLPQFKQRQIARRSTSDIDRLAKQYKSSVDAMTGEYQTAFTGYQAGVAEKMKPFEQQMKTYKESLLPTYESQKGEYQKKLDEYTKTLAEIDKNPTIEKTGTRLMVNPMWNPMSNVPTGPMNYEEEYTYYEERPIPKFTDKAPETPVLPIAPEVAAFDSTQFEAKKGQAESEFKREIGERRAAKLGAVSRKGARPLLSGAKA
jgi:hypothetical protein